MNEEGVINPVGPDDHGVNYFTKFSELKRLPVDKIDHFVIDLALWLHELARVHDLTGVYPEPGYKAFGWRDDGRHDARIVLSIKKPEGE